MSEYDILKTKILTSLSISDDNATTLLLVAYEIDPDKPDTVVNKIISLYNLGVSPEDINSDILTILHIIRDKPKQTNLQTKWYTKLIRWILRRW
jgi:hypothetical protein